MTEQRLRIKKLRTALRKQFPKLEFGGGKSIRCASWTVGATIDILYDETIRYNIYREKTIDGLPYWKFISLDEAIALFSKWNKLENFK